MALFPQDRKKFFLLGKMKKKKIRVGKKGPQIFANNFKLTLFNFNPISLLM
jgi:hypothetical protein